MLRRILNTIGCLLMLLASAAQAQYYPDVAYVYRADGMKIMLLRKVDGPDNYKYYLYSEPGIMGPGTCDEGLWYKSQNMWNMSVVLGKGSAKNIHDFNRSNIMWEDDGSAWVVQLPNTDDLAWLSEVNQQPGANGIPWNWRVGCYSGGRHISMVDQGTEFWTSTAQWNDHVTYNLGDHMVRGRWDTDQRIVALRTMKVDHNQVCLFEHGLYDGQYRCFSAGDYDDLGKLDKKFSSIVAGKNCSARLYENNNYTGRTAIYNERRKGAEPWYWLNGMNDRTSSLKVRCGDASTVGDSEVCLFEHGDESGNVACYGTGDVRHIEKYADGQNAEDTFSSMVVGKNCTIRIYEHADFRGSGMVFSGKDIGKRKRVDWLDDGAFRMNDKTSSISVTCN